MPIGYIIIVAIAFSLIIFIALKKPVLCLSLGFPALLFIGQLNMLIPISVSAIASIFPFMAFFGELIRRRSWPIFGICEKLFIFLSFVMVYSFSYTPSISRVYGGDKVILFCFMVAPVVVYTPYIITDTNKLSIFVYTILISLVAYVIISGLILINSGDIYTRSSAIGSVNMAGRYIGLAFLAIYILIILTKNNYYTIIYIPLIISNGLILFITGARQAVLGLFLSILFTHWFLVKNLRHQFWGSVQKWYLLIFTFFILSVTMIFLIIDYVPHNVISRFSSVEAFFDNFTTENIDNWEDSRSRTLNYGLAINAFILHPIRGVGAGGYKDVVSDTPKYAHHSYQVNQASHAYPHNMILEFSAEQGLIALIPIILIIYINLLAIGRLKNLLVCSDEKIIITLCASMYVYSLIVSMASTDIPRMMIFWWFMGLIIAVNNIYFKDKYKY